ncbi:divergent PAP2 family protein [Candidatus Woesearchaeota archaeon]|nr:divergent PAP2 family protein [Candidatus Woesearchaeota archaeon]
MNEILTTVIFAGVAVQLIKLLHFAIQGKPIGWHDLLVTGGMPSTHASIVSALAASVYFNESMSTGFVISSVLAAIVLLDAIGVRRSVGDEGKAIEKLFRMNQVRSKLHYAIGHTPAQVVVGVLLGILIAYHVHYGIPFAG